ncbi:hypothetical protein RUND412_009809 [Rhizina undulata]
MKNIFAVIFTLFLAKISLAAAARLRLLFKVIYPGSVGPGTQEGPVFYHLYDAPSQPLTEQIYVFNKTHVPNSTSS